MQTAYKKLRLKQSLKLFSHAPKESFLKELNTASMDEGVDYVFEKLNPKDWSKPYQSGSVFACPRSLRGGAPIKGINALKSGNALVATRTGAPCFAGLIPLSSARIDDIAKHLQTALKSPADYRCSLGFDANEQAEAYARLYASLRP